MPNYKVGYSASVAVIIAIGTQEIEQGAETLAHTLEGFPYRFSIKRLIGTSASRNAIQDTLHNLIDVDRNARILVYVATPVLVDTQGIPYLVCANSDPNNPQESAFPCTVLLNLTQIVAAKHIAFILDSAFSLTYLDQFIEGFDMPVQDKATQHKAYQLIMRWEQSTCSTLIPALLAKLDFTQTIEPISMWSIGYHLPMPCHPYAFRLKGTEDGDFIFYDSPVGHLPEDLRIALKHLEPYVRRAAISEAEDYFKSLHFRPYIQQALEEMATADPDQDVRLRAQEAIRHHKPISYSEQLSHFGTRIRDILGEPFEWGYIPKGRTTLIDLMYLKTPIDPMTAVPREYVHPKALDYFPRGGKTHLVDHFAMALFPITEAQFQVFSEKDYSDSRWWQYNLQAQQWHDNHPMFASGIDSNAHHPRTNINWFEAVAFCLWLSNKSGLSIMLPNELQWQRAAQGDDRRLYAWGNTEPDTDLVHWKKNETATVDSYPLQAQRSAYGLYQMSGNVMEMCTSQFTGGNTDIGASGKSQWRVIRGGAWNSSSDIELRTTYRARIDEDRRNISTGFRITVNSDLD